MYVILSKTHSEDFQSAFVARDIMANMCNVACFITQNVTNNQAIIPEVIIDPAAREKERLREGEYDDNEKTSLIFPSCLKM